MNPRPDVRAGRDAALPQERATGPTDRVPSVPVAAVVVAYRPDAARLAALLERLAGQVRTLYLVDNSDTTAARAMIASAAAQAVIAAAGSAADTPAATLRLIAMHGNRGIAAAQNHGLRAAQDDGHAFALLSDDDSLPPADLVTGLLARFEAVSASGRKVAAIGPLVGDTRDEAALLVFGHTWLGPRRIAGAAQADRPLHAAFLVASGCLIQLAALPGIGVMREDLFIDHVDLEWSLRARQAGWELLVDPSVRLAHRLGDRVLRLPFGTRPFHVHAPVRNYFLVRNTVLLLRGSLLPAGWRIGYLLWLAKYMLFNLAFVPPRRRRATAILRGLHDGAIGRGGPPPTIIAG